MPFEKVEAEKKEGKEEKKTCVNLPGDQGVKKTKPMKRSGIKLQQETYGTEKISPQLRKKKNNKKQTTPPPPTTTATTNVVPFIIRIFNFDGIKRKW